MPSLTRVFLSFAPEDANYRSLLVAASRAAGLPVRFVETTHHVTDSRRRVLSRAKLQQCDLAVVLTSPRATRHLAVESDMTVAREAGLPVHAIVVGRPSAESAVPASWEVSTVTGWNWPSILELLQRCPERPLEFRRAG